MTYKWDNKKPTAQMLGRWQPFHDGHYTLFKEIIKKTGQVCIQVRDVQGVDDNPFDFESVKKNIEERLNPEFEGRFKVMLVPNVTNIRNIRNQHDFKTPFKFRIKSIFNIFFYSFKIKRIVIYSLNISNLNTDLTCFFNYFFKQNIMTIVKWLPSS